MNSPAGGGQAEGVGVAVVLGQRHGRDESLGEGLLPVGEARVGRRVPNGQGYHLLLGIGGREQLSDYSPYGDPVLRQVRIALRHPNLAAGVDCGTVFACYRDLFVEKKKDIINKTKRNETKQNKN